MDIELDVAYPQLQRRAQSGQGIFRKLNCIAAMSNQLGDGIKLG
jgi:hypothetical protein